MSIETTKGLNSFEKQQRKLCVNIGKIKCCGEALIKWEVRVDDDAMKIISKSVTLERADM